MVRITGAGRLADFRERLRWLMVRDVDAEDYTEHHADGVLEYRFEPRNGIPFPAFAAASGDFPELRIEAEWLHDGVLGRAVLENGRVVQESAARPGSAAVDISVAEDGRLVLAMACRKSDDALIGYAATSERHTYFRSREGNLELVTPDTPDAPLEELAVGFVGEWLWYDEEEAPVERARYADYGYPVRGANLKSEKLALLRPSGLKFSSLDAAGREVREALIAQWLNPA
ncbi:MAG: hypothetical protein E6H47_07625 [Betaproteobacteria bacterium]|nr:MAG: hypothetical protein E6H47_07625 [Betaproteobacteria bacterium]